MLHRIRIFSTEKLHVRSFCLTAYLPPQQLRTEFKKDSKCSIPCLPGDPDYVYRTDYESIRERGEKQQSEARARRVVGLAINALLDIPGITKVQQLDYELQLTKVAAFDWSDCQDPIVEVIKTHLFPDEANVEVQDFVKKQQQHQQKPLKDVS
ncbi:MAG TPA: hypothetical protein V6C97_33930 [Oculatellaceae cyanobacterium]